MRTEFFQLEILSPVYIGTGEEIDPMAYLMRQDENQILCHVLDTRTWAAEYPDPDELSATFSGTNIPAMRSYLANHIDPALYGLRAVMVSEEKIFHEYQAKLADQHSSHQLLISPHLSCREQVPVLPGSSIKGALRTAVIDWLDREKHLNLKAARAEDRNGRAYIRRLESVLGPITDNAFKQLKIGDVMGYQDSTLLVEPRELRRKAGKEATPKTKCEVLPSRLLGDRRQALMHTRIALGSPHKKDDQRFTLPNGQSWEWNELATLANAFYRERYLEEKNKFYNLPHFAPARLHLAEIETVLLNPAPGQMVLRVGHYSQVEFVTVHNNQPFTRKGQQGTPLPSGTTRTLANGLYPFGWICLTPCTEEAYLKGLYLCESANLIALRRKESGRAEVLRERARHQEQIVFREAALRAQQAAEQRRQEELAAIPEEERNIVLLERGELNEQQIFDLFASLDSLESNLQQRAAKALKALWITEKRWSKKECSKKQLEKVKKIKSILGEP
ncbi:RAMP superfamily CRISPR-associated protein [Syntrophotalea acetylenica]|uniref:RAMP superfamily CRISPR-associated protein n=1 Tax=Syntrophotalea acetylenica TaxID=29542 RepID=UPI002A35C4E3|nr:RAMP superfamily CRISPR-associated protein [Syntrophotalea acetylenica]MDY0261382.1 RAMP superfamily CRISPR-associated protein [Syntrophotalea acetylenica]